MSGRESKPDRHRRKTVTFRLPVKLMKAMRTLAKRRGHTLACEAGLAIEAHLAEDCPKK
jgi:predicted DNA-binding protein